MIVRIGYGARALPYERARLLILLYVLCIRNLFETNYIVDKSSPDFLPISSIRN